jgi:hypothetical protein
MQASSVGNAFSHWGTVIWWMRLLVAMGRPSFLRGNMAYLAALVK